MLAVIRVVGAALWLFVFGIFVWEILSLLTIDLPEKIEYARGIMVVTSTWVVVKSAKRVTELCQ